MSLCPDLVLALCCASGQTCVVLFVENTVAVAAFRVILQRCSLAKLLRQIFTEYVALSVSV